METTPRIQPLGYALKNSPPVLSTRPPKQLAVRDEAEQVLSSREETECQTISLRDDQEELYESLPIDDSEVNSICEVKEQKVCQSINEIKLH